MPPRIAPPKRSTRRIIEDEESDGDDGPDEGQYDDEDDEQVEEAYEEDEEEYDELEEDDEDDYGETTGPKTGLKIKLNMGAAKVRAGATMASTPGDTPPFTMPRTKRSHKRRAVAASDEEREDQDEEAPSQPARKTARQAALAGDAGPVEHVSLEEPPNPRKRKWTEEEIAMRREEAARKRKVKGAQRQEDEKQMIINRLINKGTGKRGRWASKAKDPTPEVEEEAEEGGVATGAAGEGTEAGEENESTSAVDDAPTGVATPAAPTRGGWRGRGRRGRGSKIPPPPVRMHIPVMRWLSGFRDIVIDGPEEPVPIRSTELEPGDGTEMEGVTATSPMPADQPKVVVEREAFLSFSIPPELLDVTVIEPPTPPSLPRSAIRCAVKGCSLTRKYKLVGAPNPEIGACGMEHLTSLQSSVKVG